MPSIPDAIALAVRDFASVVGALSEMTAAAAAVITAMSVFVLFAGAAAQVPSAYVLIVFICTLAQLFLLTPYFIAIHRFIILGETGARFARRPASRASRSIS